MHVQPPPQLLLISTQWPAMNFQVQLPEQAMAIRSLMKKHEPATKDGASRAAGDTLAGHITMIGKPSSTVFTISAAFA
jgi:hypothetical protein